MKILLLILIFFTCAAMPAAAQQQAKSNPQKPHNGIIIENGNALLIEKGQPVPLKREMTLANGTRVDASGKVTLKNGQSFTLQNGDRVTLSGQIISSGETAERNKAAYTAGMQARTEETDNRRMKLMDEKMMLLNEKMRLLEEKMQLMTQALANSNKIENMPDAGTLDNDLKQINDELRKK